MLHSVFYLKKRKSKWAWTCLSYWLPRATSRVVWPGQSQTWRSWALKISRRRNSHRPARSFVGKIRGSAYSSLKLSKRTTIANITLLPKSSRAIPKPSERLCHETQAHQIPLQNKTQASNFPLCLAWNFGLSRVRLKNTRFATPSNPLSRIIHRLQT